MVKLQTICYCIYHYKAYYALRPVTSNLQFPGKENLFYYILMMMMFYLDFSLPCVYETFLGACNNISSHIIISSSCFNVF